MFSKHRVIFRDPKEHSVVDVGPLDMAGDTGAVPTALVRPLYQDSQ